MVYCILWEFRPKPEMRAQFEAAYGPDGAWARLFRRSAQYLGSELLRDCGDSSRYLTMDRWTSRAAFEEFHLLHRAEYDELDRRCEALTSEEAPLGSHETVDP
jgi:quinol monooxygenase YgiN